VQLHCPGPDLWYSQAAAWALATGSKGDWLAQGVPDQVLGMNWNRPEAPLDEFWRAIKLDLYGTFLGCRFGIPELIKAGGGSVINMSSNVALMGVPGRDCYTAAKGGIAAITRSLAVAYAPQRVRVNAIAPSATMTERVKRLVAGNAALTKLADSHLLGLIEPDDIAHMALYLASDESRMVTGQVLPVDSGVTIS